VALDYKTPAQVADEYLTHLKTLKPEVDTKQQDSDWVIRALTVGGVISGAYADNRKVSNDAFPSSARREALERHLETWFDDGFKEATQAQGEALVSGATGSFAAAGQLQFVYEPNGNTYQSDEDITLDATTGVVRIKSVATGQNQNLLEGAALTVSSPPAGFDSTATVVNKDLSDGRDDETNKEAADRILSRIRNPISGGKAGDYVQWAIEADDAVVSANVLRAPFGLGTVGVVISAGTTDIDEALDNGDPIVLTPSDALIETVQAYIDDLKPVTDCPTVMAPTEVAINVTARVRFSSGNANTLLSGQTLTQGELVEREIKRGIYKTPAGGRQFGGQGYVVLADLEEVLDIGLSDAPHTEGKLKILTDRQIDDLAATGFNRMILGNEVAVPGTITVIEM
jgi:uncharacterized phage protein gp47/JayE